MPSQWSAPRDLYAKPSETGDDSVFALINKDYQTIDRGSSEEPEESSLAEAISAAPQDVLLRFVQSLIRTNAVAKTAATQTFLTAIDASPVRKRKAYETCRNCGDDYNVDDNKLGDCYHHTGTKEVDDEAGVWDDHDVEIHGDHEDHEADCPEGFRYTCCDQSGNAEGCVVSKHRPLASKRART